MDYLHDILYVTDLFMPIWDLSKLKHAIYFTFVLLVSAHQAIVMFLTFRSALRHWQFQASKDGEDWITLHSHSDDTSLNEPG